MHSSAPAIRCGPHPPVTRAHAKSLPAWRLCADRDVFKRNILGMLIRRIPPLGSMAGEFGVIKRGSNPLRAVPAGVIKHGSNPLRAVPA